MKAGLKNKTIVPNTANKCLDSGECRTTVPHTLGLPVTYRCDGRCAMCSIWLKQAEAPELSLEKIKEVLTFPLVKDNIRTLIITGGEPTLREDVSDIVEIAIENLNALKKIAFISNGLHTERTLSYARRIVPLIPPDISANFGVSLDGIGATHDRVRGIEGAFGKTVATFRALKKVIAGKENLSISLGMTISRLNLHDARAVFEFARKEGVRSAFTTANVVDVYIDNIDRAGDFDFREKDRLEAAEFFEWLEERAPDPYNGMVAGMLRGGKRKMGCAARTGAMTIDVDGCVYPCGQTRKALMGNIHTENLDEIWNGERARRVQDEILPEYCERCKTRCYPETA